MREVEHILAVQARLGEGPIWNMAERKLYFVDIEGGAFHRYDPLAGSDEVFTVGLPLGCLAFRASGGLVLATRDGFMTWDMTTGAATRMVDPEPHRPHARFNDGAVDRAGRFWAGTMSEGDDNSLYRLDPEGSTHVMETGITVSNGIGWSPDNRRMYFTDSRRKLIYVYDFDLTTGETANRRVFVDSTAENGVPDGLAVDSEGCVWSARWGGWKVTRYDPDGRAALEIPFPVEYVTSCALGGPNLDELYVTTAWTAVPESQRAQQPLAGDLFRVRVGVKGLPAPLFRG